MNLTLGIDLGTSAAKVLALDDQGTVLAGASAPYPLYQPAPGWVEQDPEDWWSAVCHATRQILDQLRQHEPSIGATSIAGLALSGQMNGIVLVDWEGTPLRPSLIWLDRRSEPQCHAANEIAGDLLRERALHVLNPVNTLAKLL